MSHVYPIPIIFLDGYQCHIHVSYKECAHMHKNTKRQVSTYLSRCNIKWDICWKKNSLYQYLFLYIFHLKMDQTTTYQQPKWLWDSISQNPWPWREVFFLFLVIVYWHSGQSHTHWTYICKSVLYQYSSLVFQIESHTRMLKTNMNTCFPFLLDSCVHAIFSMDTLSSRTWNLSCFELIMKSTFYQTI
jgi:hypothetical protein